MEKSSTMPGRNGGELRVGGPGRPKGSVNLTTELKRQLEEGATLEQLVKATIIQLTLGIVFTLTRRLSLS